MTITNRDLFERDPTATKIPNNGVAQVVRPETAQQWEVLEWELKNFVCDGEYTRGLERILGGFLTGLRQSQQPAVWISGFYGSGKSHLVRVLEYLWRDLQLPSGESARGLATLPNEVHDHLTELSAAAKRAGGLWSAAGTLASGRSDTVRLAFLSVLFENAGLPQQYPLARFMIWARENGYLDAVGAAVHASGKSLDEEVRDLYVSPVIARALLDADTSLGDSVKDVRELLAKQFPPMQKDITDDELFAVMDKVLHLQSAGTKLPLTLVILDEMQQYINEDSEKALAVQNIVEGCSARFQSQILFIATGQSALTATPTLQKLTDRFPVQVALSDKDVETVVRKVILHKRPEHVGVLKAKLESVSGEIDRHLAGTQFAPRAADKQDLASDYPLIPTRRRFWELALRSIDRAGQTGVLRTQLRVIHEAARKVADEEIGHVVGGDFIYEQQADGMLRSGMLLNEVYELIRDLRAEGEDGLLKSRICALVFLITQLPERTLGGGETGLRATAPFIADLLVEDLAHDGALLRKQVPELLDALVANGGLMQIDDSYRLQTAEGAEWEKDYRRRRAAIRDDAGRMSELRGERLVQAIERELAGLKPTHGTSKTSRKIALHWGEGDPAISDGDVPVWVRDEWSVTEGAMKRSAAEASEESPIVFVFLPKRETDRIRELLASHAAAQDTVNQRPTPQTDEGKAAQQAMQTRAANNERELNELFQGVAAHARIFQGGGGEITKSSLRSAVETAAGRSLVRMFPKFTAADNANWDKVLAKAREGAPDALNAVGHNGGPTMHPVCKVVLTAISAAGTKGAELHRRFAAPPFGWPKDAINGAILTLLAARNIRASQEGKDITPKALLPSQIGKIMLYKEDEPPTVEQRLAVKGLLVAAGIRYEDGEEGARIPALLQLLTELAGSAGGLPPLPEAPRAEHIDSLSALGGNQLVRAVAEIHEQLRHDLESWREARAQRAKREIEWDDLKRLLRHAEGLPEAERVASASAAILDGRQLLEHPDPMQPLLDALGGALRKELKQRTEQLASEQQAAVRELEDWEEWGRLDPRDARTILEEAQLISAPSPAIANHAELLEALDALSLSGWLDRIDFVSSRREQARRRAAKLLEPESVSVVPLRATLKTREDLEAYLSALREQVLPYLKDEKTVII